MRKYTISVLTFRSYPLVKACIASILKHSPLDQIKVVLTDNGAGKQCAEYFEEVRAQNPEIFEVIHHAENRGFIPPNNEIFERCDTPYFVLLNDDVEIQEDGWLQKMEAPLLQFPRASLSGPKGGCQSLTPNFDGRPTGPFEYLEGSVLMIKCDTRKPLPLFPSYLEFAYAEDSCLSLEQRQKGYTLHQIDLKFFHLRGATAKHIPEIKTIQAKNHQAARKKFSHYLRVRKFDYPIVVRRWAARGDVLLITPILRQLAKENPLCTIEVETAFPELFAGNPYVKGAAQRVHKTVEARFINLDMAYERFQCIHIVDAYAKTADVELTDKSTEIYYTKEENETAEKMTESLWEFPFCVVHAGPTTWPGKNWPTDSWAELIRALKRRGLRTILVGHNDATMIPCDLDFRGQTSPGLLAAIIDRSELFIGLDSFPLHVAQAVGKPVIGLFGCTSPEYILTEGSWHRGVSGAKDLKETGIRHRVVGHTSIPTDGSSMRSITVQAVLDSFQELNWKRAKKEEVCV